MGKKKRYSQPQTSSVESGAETSIQSFEKYTSEEIGALTAAEVLEEIIAAHGAESSLDLNLEEYIAQVDARLATISDEDNSSLYTPEALEKFNELKLTPYFTSYTDEGRFVATSNIVPFYIDAETVGKQHANTVMALASPYFSTETTTIPSEDYTLISNAILDAEDAMLGHFIELDSLKSIREWFRNVTPVSHAEASAASSSSLPEEEPAVAQDSPQTSVPEESESESQVGSDVTTSTSDEVVPEASSLPTHDHEDETQLETESQVSGSEEIEEQPVETSSQPDVNPDAGVVVPDTESQLNEAQSDQLTDGSVSEHSTGEEVSVTTVSEVSEDSRTDELPPTTQEDSVTNGEATLPPAEVVEVASDTSSLPEEEVSSESQDQEVPSVNVEEQPAEVLAPSLPEEVSHVESEPEVTTESNVEIHTEIPAVSETDSSLNESITGSEVTSVDNAETHAEIQTDTETDHLLTEPTVMSEAPSSEDSSQDNSETSLGVEETSSALETTTSTESTESTESAETVVSPETTDPTVNQEDTANTSITEVAVGTEVATDVINAPKEENKDPNEFTVNSEFSPTVQLILSQLKDYTERMGIGIIVDRQTINMQQRRLNRLLVQILMTVNQKDFEDLMYETTNLFIEHRDRCFGKAYAYRGIDEISTLEMDSKERMRFYGLIDAFRGLADPTKHARLASNFAFSEILSTTPEQYAARFVLFCKKYCE